MLSFLKVDSKKKLKKALGDFELPIFPRSTHHVLRLLREPDARPAQIARAVEGDPNLTVRLLRTVNSAAYAPRQPVRSLDQAVVMLGHASLEQIALSMAVADSLPVARNRGLVPERFWTAAAIRGATARILAESLHPCSTSESFTCGLLQDMAIPLLARSRGEEYADVLERWHQGDEPLDLLEREALGFDHAEVATWLCAVWELPDSMAHALGGHHGHPDYQCPPAVELVGNLRECRAEQGKDELVAAAVQGFRMAEDLALSALEEGEQRAEELARLLH